MTNPDYNSTPGSNSGDGSLLWKAVGQSTARKFAVKPFLVPLCASLNGAEKHRASQSRGMSQTVQVEDPETTLAFHTARIELHRDASARYRAMQGGQPRTTIAILNACFETLAWTGWRCLAGEWRGCK